LVSSHLEVLLLLGHLRKNLTERDWMAVVVDVTVVIVSILLAFQIDRWAEQNRNRQLEMEYLVRLKQDLRMEIGQMDTALGYVSDRLQAVRLLEVLVEDPTNDVNSSGFLPWAIETATWRSFPQIASFVYRELQSTGNLALIQTESLRRDLAGHYNLLQNDALTGLDLNMQHLFNGLTAGLLTSDELIEVENTGSAKHPAEISTARAMEIAEAFIQTKGAIAILPNLVHHHAFIKKVIIQAKDRTRILIEQIDELIIQLE